LTEPAITSWSLDEPLGRPGALSSRLTRRGARRLGRIRRALGRSSRGGAWPRGEAVLGALAATLASLPPGPRARALRGPDVRGFLSEAETWLAVRRLAAEVMATGRRAPSPARRTRLLARLFDRLARTEHLAALAPRGRIDAALPGRCLTFARRRLADAVADLSAFLLGLRLVHPSPGVVDVRLRFREDPEQGRPAGRIDLGACAGPAGALGIVGGPGTLRRGARDGARRHSPARAGVRATLRGRTLFLRAPGAAEVVLPAAGSRLMAPERPAGRDRRTGDALRLVRRNLIPGTSIVLTPVLDSSPRRLRVTRDTPGFGPRLARALRVLMVAWPEAHREILRRTYMVVPVREPGTVSWSLASRPGVSFINLSGKSIIDLADDLLHETAHHRLHDLQEVATFLVRGPDTEEVQAFDSPWRGARRPLHGLLHGAFTFLFRAELLRLVLRVARAHPRLLARDLGRSEPAILRRELGRETRMIASALRDLEGAAHSGLLAPSGRRLLRSMRSWSARLRRRP